MNGLLKKPVPGSTGGANWISQVAPQFIPAGGMTPPDPYPSDSRLDRIEQKIDLAVVDHDIVLSYLREQDKELDSLRAKLKRLASFAGFSDI